jgi:translation initiation factor IF-3
LLDAKIYSYATTDEGVLSRPYSPRTFSPASFVRVNGKIRAREVRVIGVDGKQLGVISLNDAINLARQNGVDLVEIAATATPPVCRLVDFGKYRYEMAKKEKDSKKHQHASTVKEVQLSPRIDPHDLGIKLMHAVNFLCEDMKVKIALKFRGREMAHTEVGFEVINKFINDIAPFIEMNPSAENMAKYFYDEIKVLLDGKTNGRVRVKHVKMWETDTTAAIYFE